MASFPFRIVGFDLDGTLLDTGDDITAAANHALAALGRAPLSRSQVLALVGGGMARLVAGLIDSTGGGDAGEQATALAALETYYDAHVADHSRPYPGAVAALDALAATGARLGVVTNKPERFARVVLAKTGIADRFGCIIGGDTLGPGRNKPARDPIDAMIDALGGGRTAYVGDSRYDVAAARAAGVPVIACTFGFDGASARDLGADAAIDHFDDLISALSGL